MGFESEIMVVPFFGQGHLFPSMELCKHLALRNYHSTLVVSSNLSSSVPSSLREFPGVEVLQIEACEAVPPPPPAGVEPDMGGFHKRHQQTGDALETLLSGRVTDTSRPVCAILDNMMAWSKEIFSKFGVPTVALFTSGACSAALEYGGWKSQAEDLKPDEIRLIPGLPEEMGITYLDTKRKPRSRGPGGPPMGVGPPGSSPGPSIGGSMMGPPGPFGGPGFSGPPMGLPDAGGPRGGPGGGKFPPGPGQQPMWINEVEGSIGLMINTCDDLEGPFIKYLTEKIEKPVWGVGPLLPEDYWKAAGSLLRDGKIRPKKQSNYSEEEVIQWLDSKPRGSVLYVSFGSEVGPMLEEYEQLADALAESDQPFIWVIQPNSGKSGPPPAMMGQKPDTEKQSEGYYPRGLDGKVGSRGLIMRGWAPQLLILSHPSTGGFLSHCGWNSTVEAIGRGIPFLAWPIRGDQFYDAKLVVCHLRIGYMVADDLSETVNKEDIKKGIAKLMSNKEMKMRAEKIGKKFEKGFPASSSAALDGFRDFLGKKTNLGGGATLN